MMNIFQGTDPNGDGREAAESDGKAEKDSSCVRGNLNENTEGVDLDGDGGRISGVFLL